MPNIPALIESAAGGNVEDFRTLMLSMYAQFGLINNTNGLNWLEPTSTTQKASSPPPPQATFTVTPSNGLLIVEITNPSSGANKQIYHELSYSTVKNFSQNVQTLPVSSNTFAIIPAVGQQVWVRLRSSYDRSTWNTPLLQSYSSAVSSAGKQASSAIENNVSLNQTNYAYVDSVANGASAAVRIYGVAGPYKSYQRVLGSTLATRPSGTIINVPYGVDQFVSWDGSKFRLAPILSGIFPDTWEPVGKVSVIAGGAFALPMVSLVLGAGGSVIGWNVDTQGNDLVGPVTLTIVTSTGTGATSGPQTIQNGKLTLIANGNPGSGYAGGDTVTVSGGTVPSSTGGGTALGSNGGRLTAV